MLICALMAEENSDVPGFSRLEYVERGAPAVLLPSSVRAPLRLAVQPIG